MLGLLPLLTTASILHSPDESIPQWIKKDAKWWHEDKISDIEFINGMKWLIEKKIISIKYATSENRMIQAPPPTIKEIAYFWSIGVVPDKDFVGTVRYMIKNGIIDLNDESRSQMMQNIKNVAVFNDTKKSVVIIPVLTSSAYSERGFYAHYRGECKDCLTVKIQDSTHSLVDSSNGVKVLKSLGYQTITDIDIDKNPGILKKYDKVILLHNEYVTQREFDAIIGHPHVIYLYPNSLYAKVSINYWNDTITLIRGHGYPDSHIKNGFDWKFDNSKFEYDRDCENWSFHKISNGMMLDCYPEGRLDYDMFLLQAIKEF